MPFATLFPEVQGMEEHPFMGDTTAWDRILGLAQGPRPAVGIEKDQIALTGFGRQCLDGNADFIAANGRPMDWRGSPDQGVSLALVPALASRGGIPDLSEDLVDFD